MQGWKHAGQAEKKEAYETEMGEAHSNQRKDAMKIANVFCLQFVVVSCDDWGWMICCHQLPPSQVFIAESSAEAKEIYF